MSPVTAPPPANPAPITSLHVNGGLFFREDEALKKHLVDAHIVTFDQTSPSGGRLLSVYFRNPEVEVRERVYPFILIDRIGWDREADREMRGPFFLPASDPYQPDGTDRAVAGGVSMVRRRTRAAQAEINNNYRAQDLPIPIMIRYQVQAWTRKKQQMLWVENQMVSVLPNRFGAINMASSSFARDDNTVRRMDFMGSAPSEMPDPENSAKRLFGRTWTVGISSEILPSDLERAGAFVQRVIIDPSDRPGYDSLT